MTGLIGNRGNVGMECRQTFNRLHRKLENGEAARLAPACRSNKSRAGSFSQGVSVPVAVVGHLRRMRSMNGQPPSTIPITTSRVQRCNRLDCGQAIEPKLLGSHSGIAPRIPARVKTGSIHDTERFKSQVEHDVVVQDYREAQHGCDAVDKVGVGKCRLRICNSRLHLFRRREQQQAERRQVAGTRLFDNDLAEGGQRELERQKGKSASRRGRPRSTPYDVSQPRSSASRSLVMGIVSSIFDLEM